MRKIDVIEQMEHSECGMVCVAMILNYFGNSITMSELREKYGIPNGGLNLLQMSMVLEDFGLKSKGVRINDVRALENSHTPFIAFWKGNHFVIIEKIKETITIVDPSSGRRKISYNEFIESFSGVALLVLSKLEKKVRNKSKKYSFFIDELRKNKAYILLVIILSITLQGIAIGIPKMIAKLTDYILIEKATNTNPFILQFFIMTILYYLMSIFRTIIVVKVQTLMDISMLSKTIDHLLKVPIQFYTSRSKGELLFRINSNSYIRQILSEKVVSVSIDLIFTIIYIVALLRINIKLTGIVSLVGLFIFMLSMLYTRALRSIQQNQIIYSTKTQNIVTELVNNIDTLKAFGVESHVLEKWKNSFLSQMKFEEKKAKYTGFIGSLPITIQMMFPALMFLIGGVYIGKGELTIGNLIAFNTLGGLFLSPILSLAGSYSDIEIVKIYFNKLFDILSTREQKNGIMEIDKIEGDIRIENLYFQYNKLSPYVLYDINIDIKKGQKVAIVGESGSGKSTLLKLLCRLYDPTQGTIKLDNIPIENFRNEDFYRNIGVVLQQPQLFNESIKENILLHRTISEERLLEVINELNIDKIVEELPIGIETILSEDGINFSGGQRQRITLARAIVHNPSLLFLDEPTSSLDNKAEKEFMDLLLKLNSTSIVIAHRFYNIEAFDKIVVMSKGRIVDVGHHNELIENCAYYQELYLRDKKTEKQHAIS
ncbi:Leukotoxin translocation ATP-binding protein lktB [Proteiniborus sp. DW1]|uniref:peptidase domain-containing ABC transporter n=1 Tax=Proteiniborus sp. DW1 TaxID=1889883 RepID=UPI00092E0C68|nr:peptidase domain-containing ABC transporter [Proteiniborus sp. DW1]SCG83744.1 Leukotoxin translocation ATP-binding protein lktB [Proteiniborus sp. DW1]